MKKQSVIHNTFVIERSYPATPARVFAALSDPAKKRRWMEDMQRKNSKWIFAKAELNG